MSPEIRPKSFGTFEKRAPDYKPLVVFLQLPSFVPHVSGGHSLVHGNKAFSMVFLHHPGWHRRTRVLLLFLTFLAISPAIFLNTLVPSLSLKKNSHHGEENRNESGSCMKPGTGITAQAKTLTFKTHSPIELREQLQLSLLC